MMRLAKFLLILAMAISVLSCGGFPSGKEVMDEFRVQNPMYQPLSAVVGEGNFDAAYFHIQYKKPNDDHVYEQGWQYLRREDGKIHLSSKGTETLIK